MAHDERPAHRAPAFALDQSDRRLLNLMQHELALEPRPYARIARGAGLTEGQALVRAQRLLDEKVIRQIAPIYDTRALGYSSTLAAARVPPERLARAVEVLNAHPGVSHNYLRDHDLNVWFTIAVAPDSALGLDRTLEILRRLTGADSLRKLPTLRLFKIRVSLDMEGGAEALAETAAVQQPPQPKAVPYDALDVEIVRATQTGLPVLAQPYARAAEQLAMGQEQLLEHMRGMRRRGLLRRVAAILSHRRAGFSANGMGVWKVPAERVLEVGAQMASVRGVSHCYQRPTYDDWPYSIFTMVHGRSRAECEAVLEAIAQRTGVHEWAVLYSSTEFKKARLRYFADEFNAWEREHSGL